jgi:hypothetical protein
MRKNIFSWIVGFLIRVVWASLVGVTRVSSANPICMTDSHTNSLGEWVLINSAPCGTYGEVVSRWETNNNVAIPVTLKYMINDPAGPAKAILILFTGGTGDAGIVPGTNGTVTSTATNFLVRSAQLFANAGYRAVTMDSPENGVGIKLYTNNLPNPTAAFDLYRVSVQCAWDIEKVIKQIPGWTNLHIFLAGTSRGSLTAVAQSQLGMGICLSSCANAGNPSPGNPLYIGEPSQPALQPSSVTVPAQFLVNADDDCPVASPAVTTNTLWKQFTGDTVLFGTLNFPPDVLASTNSDSTDPCGATAPHGYLGIETAAVGTITSWLDQLLNHFAIKNAVALDTSLELTNLAPVPIDLSLLISQPLPPGVPVEVSLPYATSVLGVRLSLTGSTVNYVPNGSGVDDGFLYQFTDTNGVRSIGSVRIQFGERPQLAVRSTAPGSVTFFWPEQSAGWFLQETPTLWPASWSFSISGSTNPATVPIIPQPEYFYRLYKP